MRKKVVKVVIDGVASFNVPLELDDFVKDHDLPLRLETILKDAITGRKQMLAGIRWDPEALARDRLLLGGFAGAFERAPTKRKVRRGKGSAEG